MSDLFACMFLLLIVFHTRRALDSVLYRTAVCHLLIWHFRDTWLWFLWSLKFSCEKFGDPLQAIVDTHILGNRE